VSLSDEMCKRRECLTQRRKRDDGVKRDGKEKERGFGDTAGAFG
jgi:hypothetical protein